MRHIKMPFFGSWLVSETLPPGILADAQQVARRTRFEPVDKGNGEVLYCGNIPRFINMQLNMVMAQTIGKPLTDVASFYRLNTSRHDTHFRVHNDGVIQEQQPDYAGVFYLETDHNSGTAFFRHPDYGAEDPRLRIFDVDDGLWEPYMQVTAEANDLLIYKTSLFHGRFPWVAKGTSRSDGRIVIVKFMKEI